MCINIAGYRIRAYNRTKCWLDRVYFSYKFSYKSNTTRRHSNRNSVRTRILHILKLLYTCKVMSSFKHFLLCRELSWSALAISLKEIETPWLLSISFLYNGGVSWRIAHFESKLSRTENSKTRYYLLWLKIEIRELQKQKRGKKESWLTVL